MKRAFLLSAAVLLLAALMVGCGGRGQNGSNPDLSRAISDEATGGTEGFLFLPPIAPAYPYDGVFDPNVTVKVEIHQIDSSGNLLSPDVLAVTFNMAVASAPADEGIRVDTSSQLYIVNWHTDRYDLQDRGFYRIFVKRASDNAEYGFADVEIFTSAKEAKSLVTQDTVALLDGRTLPIKLRIEQGAIPRVPGGRIAFHSNRDGIHEIYVMNSDGSNQTNLTNNPAYDLGPSWSPDGRKIAFESYRDGSWEVHVMNSDGTNQVNLTNNPASDWCASWSPDGMKIAFMSNRGGNWDIYVMNSDGSNQTRLTNNPAYDWGPSWSPDGSKIAFHSNRDGNDEIYVMNSDGSNPTRLTNNPAPDYYPSWSPDGSKIAFTSNRDGNNAEIYVMNPDGTNQTRLTNNPAIDWWPSCSPDGSKIAFLSNRDGNDEIYVMNSDGSNQTNLTNNPALDGTPSWSAF